MCIISTYYYFSLFISGKVKYFRLTTGDILHCSAFLFYLLKHGERKKWNTPVAWHWRSVHMFILEIRHFHSLQDNRHNAHLNWQWCCHALGKNRQNLHVLTKCIYFYFTYWPLLWLTGYSGHMRWLRDWNAIKSTTLKMCQAWTKSLFISH